MKKVFFALMAVAAIAFTSCSESKTGTCVLSWVPKSQSSTLGDTTMAFCSRVVKLNVRKAIKDRQYTVVNDSVLFYNVSNSEEASKLLFIVTYDLSQEYDSLGYKVASIYDDDYFGLTFGIGFIGQGTATQDWLWKK